MSKPIDGKAATQANGGTIGFQMKDAAQAEAWHKAGVANGGTSIEDPPGVRANGAYLAYLRDPDGNKLVGVARPAACLSTEEDRPRGRSSPCPWTDLKPSGMILPGLDRRLKLRQIAPEKVVPTAAVSFTG